ncbi:N-acetylmuramoyl-L-alanine amidase [Sphingomonas sp. C8-2]|nr:N-acetylmuramoyl-L-alanine amidase [Sphingomonas sp. C8-2]
MMPIRYLTIHCAATIEGRDHKAAEVTRWDVARFGQPSYHWVVELDGTAVRTLADATRGAHVGGHNTGNIGICYVGGLGRDAKPKDTRNALQRKSLREIVEAYQRKYPGVIVRGHRDWSPDLDRDGKIEPHEWVKACPCFDVATEL